MRHLLDHRWHGLLVAILVFAGCKPVPEVAIEAKKQTADVGRANVSIVTDKIPSEEDKSAMLVAKDAMFTRLSGALMDAMASGGPAAAITVCKTKAPEIAEEVSRLHDLRIGRTGVRLRNLNNTAPGWAAKMTEDMIDNPQFVSLSNGGSAALLPIKMQAMCLMCHGPEEQLVPEIKTKLSELYPDDRATGFQEGELRGWFWIEMEREA